MEVTTTTEVVWVTEGSIATEGVATVVREATTVSPTIVTTTLAPQEVTTTTVETGKTLLIYSLTKNSITLSLEFLSLAIKKI